MLGYYTFNEKGELTQGEGEIEKTVCVWKGSQPLSLGVRENDGARLFEGRFTLNAYYDPWDVAGVVVGVRIGSEATAPKIEVSQAEQPGTVTLSGTSPDTFKAPKRS